MKSYVATVTHGRQSTVIRIRATNVIAALEHLKARLYEFKSVSGISIEETEGDS